VLAAARDLPGGVALGGADVRTVNLPAELVPAGAVKAATEVGGRILAAPTRSGEPLTDARFVSPGLAGGLSSGLVAYPLRLDDAEVAALLRVGDRIDLYCRDQYGGRVCRPTGAQRAGRGAADGNRPRPGRGRCDRSAGRGRGHTRHRFPGRPGRGRLRASLSH
jgi:hypothetical protein